MAQFCAAATRPPGRLAWSIIPPPLTRDQEGTRVRACRASRDQEDVVEVAVRCRRRSPQGPAKVAASEGHDQVPVPGERPAAQGREDIAEPDRDAGSPAGEASRDQSSAVESALRPQERAAGQTALGAQPRSAARRARPRPHPTARARGAYRRAQPAAGCVRLRTVRAALCAERRRGIHPRRDRGQGPQAGDPPSALAPDLRVRVVAHGSVGAAGAAPVPQNAYGTSFWARFLFERYACLRPVHRVAAWMSGQGLAVSPGTLGNSPKRFVPLFEPMAEAILAHQSKAALRHADETSWRVQELRGEDRSSRAWLWTSVSSDAVCSRGRDAGCPAPPAQIRTGPLGHPAPPLGSAPHSADGKSLVWPRVSDFQPGPMGLSQCRNIGPCRAVLLRP